MRQLALLVIPYRDRPGCLMWLPNDRVATVDRGEVTDLFQARGFMLNAGMDRDGWPTPEACSYRPFQNWGQSGTIHNAK